MSYTSYMKEKDTSGKGQLFKLKNLLSIFPKVSFPTDQEVPGSILGSAMWLSLAEEYFRVWTYSVFLCLLSMISLVPSYPLLNTGQRAGPLIVSVFLYVLYRNFLQHKELACKSTVTVVEGRNKERERENERREK